MILLFVNICILVINLDLMEAIISNSFSMNNKSTLSNSSDLILNILIIIIISIIINTAMLGRKDWLWSSYNLKRNKFSIITDRYKSPVIVTTFPEFAKVDIYFLTIICWVANVSIFNLVPGQDWFVVSFNWRRCWKTKENLWIFVFWFLCYTSDNKVLSNTSYCSSKCFLQLPVKVIIKHVEINYTIVSDWHIRVAQQLN